MRYYKTHKNPEQYIDALEKKHTVFFWKISRPTPNFFKYDDTGKYFLMK